MKKIDKWLICLLVISLTLGWVGFMVHHNLEEAAILGGLSITLMGIFVLLHGLENICVVGFFGAGFGSAVGLALWEHSLFLVLGCWICVCLIGAILGLRIRFHCG
ncbi:hypothetical protein KKC63_02665 [Patescibacteria group bacterium]|nr:hypothetical protein [Patescibacteria group bacterium]MBU4078454.1 hypothetical protein [Patescibacteria group bacterium]